jgi:hypothetical protein
VPLRQRQLRQQGVLRESSVVELLAPASRPCSDVTAEQWRRNGGEATVRPAIIDRQRHGWDGVAQGSCGRTLVSRVGRNCAGCGDRPEQGRGLGKETPTSGPQVAATEARAVMGRLRTRDWARALQ